MRKIFIGIACLILILSGCSAQETAKQDASPKSENVSASAPSTKEEEKKPQKTHPALSSQVLYEKDGVRITLKDTEIAEYQTFTLPVLVENDTDKNICVQLRDIAVNGIMYECIFSSDVAPGKKNNDSIMMMKSDERIKFESISDIEFSFHIFDNDTWDTIDDSEILHLHTTDEAYVYVPDTSGETLYEGNGLRIIYQGLMEDYMGLNVLLLMENDSDEYITVQARDVSVNGFMIDPILSADIMPGRKAYTYINFLGSYMEENELTKDDIEEIELSFHVFGYMDFMTGYDTETITIPVK